MASQQHPTDSQWHSTVPCGVGDQLHVSCDFQHCCPSTGWRSPHLPKWSCCQNGPVHAWDGPHMHMHACMHACPSCLILLSSILSHPLLLSHHRHRGTFAMAHPCHACFLGISLSFFPSQLGVGAHSDWSSACASSKGQDHAEMQFLWIVSIITKPSYVVLTHTWNNVKQPKVPVYKTFGS